MKKNLFLILAIVAIALISACGKGPARYRVQKHDVDSTLVLLRLNNKASSHDALEIMQTDSLEVANWSDLDKIIAQNNKLKLSKVFGEQGYNDEVSRILSNISEVIASVPRDTTFVPFFTICQRDTSGIGQKSYTYQDFRPETYAESYLLTKSLKKDRTIHKR